MLLESLRRDTQLPEGIMQGFPEEMIIQLGLEGEYSSGWPLICILGKGTDIQKHMVCLGNIAMKPEYTDQWEVKLGR